MRLNDGGQRWWWWWCVRQMEIKTKVDWMFDGFLCTQNTYICTEKRSKEWENENDWNINKEDPVMWNHRARPNAFDWESESELLNRNGCNVTQPLKISARVWIWWSRVGREAKIYWYWAISFRRDSYTYTAGICGKRNQNETYTHTLSLSLPLAVIIIIIYLIIPSGRCRVITIYLFPLRCFHRYSNSKPEGKEWQSTKYARKFMYNLCHNHKITNQLHVYVFGNIPIRRQQTGFRYTFRATEEE